MLFWMVSLALAVPGDLDDDGIEDIVDNCPGVANSDQADDNRDGWGEACVDVAASVHPTATLGRNTRVRGASMVAAGAILGDDVQVIDSVIGRQSRVDDGAVVDGSVALRGTQIGADSELTNASLSVFTTIGSGAVLNSTVTHARVDIGRDTTLTNALIGRSSQIGAEATVLGVVAPTGIVGFRSTVGDGALLRAAVTVASGAVVEPSARIGRDGFVANGVTIGASARLRSGVFATEDVAPSVVQRRQLPANHPPVLLDLVLDTPIIGLGETAQASARATDRENDPFVFTWFVDGAWDLAPDNATATLTAPRPDAAGFDDRPQLTVDVRSDSHVDTAATGAQLTAPSTCAQGTLPTGRTFVQIADSDQRWYEVWCDNETAGGGWTIFHPDDLGQLGFDPDTLRNTTEQVLVWIARNDGAQFTTLLEQLPQFAVYNINTSANTRFVNVVFIPTNVANVAGATQGIRSNGSNLSFINCDANPNSYLRFYQSGETAGNQTASNDYGMSYRWRDTKVGAVSPIDSDFFALTEFHQGGCGTFSTSNRWAAYDGTTGAALGIR